MRTMYDGVDIDTVPAGADVYAGYVGGYWPTYAGLVAKFPFAEHVSIAVNASENAQVLDVENGDATAADVPNWLERQRFIGQVRPTVYCSRIGSPGEGWQACMDAVTAAGMIQPDYWIADYTGVAHNLFGAAAVQWIDHGGYDESQILDDYWPFMPPSPAPTPKPPVKKMPVLKPGAIRPAVRTLRRLLIKNGYKVPAFGLRYGPTLQAAVIAFKKAHGLPADPIVGSKTWKLLRNSAA